MKVYSSEGLRQVEAQQNGGGGRLILWFLLLIVLLGGAGGAAWYFGLIPVRELGLVTPDGPTDKTSAVAPPGPEVPELDPTKRVLLWDELRLGETAIQGIEFARKSPAQSGVTSGVDLGALLVWIGNADSSPRNLDLVQVFLIDDEGRQAEPLQQGSPDKRCNPGTGVVHAFAFHLTRSARYSSCLVRNMVTKAHGVIDLANKSSERGPSLSQGEITAAIRDKLAFAEEQQLAMAKNRLKTPVPTIVKPALLPSATDKERQAALQQLETKALQGRERLAAFQAGQQTLHERLTELALQLKEKAKELDKMKKKDERATRKVSEYNDRLQEEKQALKDIQTLVKDLNAEFPKAPRHDQLRMKQEIVKAETNEGRAKIRVADAERQHKEAILDSKAQATEVKNLEKEATTLRQEEESKKKEFERLQEKITTEQALLDALEEQAQQLREAAAAPQN